MIDDLIKKLFEVKNLMISQKNISLFPEKIVLLLPFGKLPLIYLKSDTSKWYMTVLRKIK